MATPTASVADNNTVGWHFDNTYARLPGVLFAPARPVAVRAPQVSILNHRLADELGLDLGALVPDAAAALFAGSEIIDWPCLGFRTDASAQRFSSGSGFAWLRE